MRHARGERGMIGLAAAVASVVIVAVIGGALLVHAYSDTVRNLTRKDSIGYLADISSQITENVRTVTSQIFSAMETIERGQMTLVENGATLDELNGEMAEDRDRWNLSRLAYVDEDGVWYFADTTQRYTRSQDYLNKTLLEGKRSISGIETMDGQDVLVFSIPVNAVIDGHHMKALAGVYGVDEMLQLLSIDSFEGRGYACIVKDDGSVAVRPEDQTAISGEYNIVSALESQNADDEEPVHVLRAGLHRSQRLRRSEDEQPVSADRGGGRYGGVGVRRDHAVHRDRAASQSSTVGGHRLRGSCYRRRHGRPVSRALLRRRPNGSA